MRYNYFKNMNSRLHEAIMRALSPLVVPVLAVTVSWAERVMICGHHLQNHFLFGGYVFVASPVLLVTLTFASKPVKCIHNGLWILTGQTVGDNSENCIADNGLLVELSKHVFCFFVFFNLSQIIFRINIFTRRGEGRLNLIHYELSIIRNALWKY